MVPTKHPWSPKRRSLLQVFQQPAPAAVVSRGGVHAGALVDAVDEDDENAHRRATQRKQQRDLRRQRTHLQSGGTPFPRRSWPARGRRPRERCVGSNLLGRAGKTPRACSLERRPRAAAATLTGVHSDAHPPGASRRGGAAPACWDSKCGGPEGLCPPLTKEFHTRLSLLPALHTACPNARARSSGSSVYTCLHAPLTAPPALRWWEPCRARRATKMAERRGVFRGWDGPKCPPSRQRTKRPPGARPPRVVLSYDGPLCAPPPPLSRTPKQLAVAPAASALRPAWSEFAPVGTQHSASATRLYADQRTLAAPRPPSAPTRA